MSTRAHVWAWKSHATLQHPMSWHHLTDYSKSRVRRSSFALDHGSEFVACAVKDWLAKSGVETLYIEPGSRWQNPYSESFNSRFRDELLNREVFTSLTEAQVLVEDYRHGYNTERPHSSLGYLTPTAFCLAAQNQPLNSVTYVGL